MFYSMAPFKLKPGADIADISRTWNELAVPIVKKIPGLISIDIYKYSNWGGSPSEWEYIYIEVWESKDAHDKSYGKYTGPDGEIAKTGYYKKAFELIEKYTGFHGSPIG